MAHPKSDPVCPRGQSENGQVGEAQGNTIQSQRKSFYSDLLHDEQLGNAELLPPDGLQLMPDDVDERASQTLPMKHIYTYAKPTLTWLGPGNATYDRVAECPKLVSSFQPRTLGIPCITG